VKGHKEETGIEGVRSLFEGLSTRPSGGRVGRLPFSDVLELAHDDIALRDFWGQNLIRQRGSMGPRRPCQGGVGR
jgi:hypothetical protein